MNTLMYEHPLTAQHLQIIREVVRYNVVGPIGKGLACGDVGALYARHLCSLELNTPHLSVPTLSIPISLTGLGAMTEWRDIVQIVVKRFHLKKRIVTNTTDFSAL
jgi:phosphopantothenoylcysteine decarboxylase